jgi:hypothetical protein
MEAAARGAAALICLLPLVAASSAAAEDFVLRPRLRAGDSYLLSLRVSTRTEARGAAAHNVFEEDVRLAYDAFVVVLEADEDGRPVRERHEGVRLTFERPGESGSLFKPDTTYEVRRRDELQIFADGARADPRIEQTVGEVLGRQFEFTLEPALLDPGGSVDVGETWEPNLSLARRLLLGRGVRVLEFGRGSGAKLERRDEEEDGGLRTLVYTIPVARFELSRMPPYAEVQKAQARLEGRIQLGDGPGEPPVSWSSSLTLDMKGVSSPPGTEVPAPWLLRRTVKVEKASPGTQDLAAPE